MLAAQRERREIVVSDALRQYIADLVRATRNHPFLRYGASPRGALALMRAGQAVAGIRGRSYVLPDDIKALVRPVLSHRLILTDTERMRGEHVDNIVTQILETTPVPATAE